MFASLPGSLTTETHMPLAKLSIVIRSDYMLNILALYCRAPRLLGIYRASGLIGVLLAREPMVGNRANGSQSL